MMNQNIKNILGGVAAVALVVVTIALWNWVGAYSQSAIAGATFQVTGQGKAVGVPDVAEFTATVTVEGGKDIASLQSDNTTRMNKVIDFLKSSGVDKKDIETQNYSIQPRYQSYSCPPVVYAGGAATPTGGANMPTVLCPPASIVGYTVTQSVQVKVRDFSKIGDILGGVSTAGANEVSSLNFSVDDPTALESEARAKAIADAQTQAQAMAKAGGFSLGRLIGVDQSRNMPTYYKSYALDATAGMGGAAPSPTIEPGSQQYDEQITLTYEIR